LTHETIGRMTSQQTEPRPSADASMSLLRDIMTNSLDTGYREAAARRATGTSGRRVLPTITVGIGTVVGALVLGLLLATAAEEEHQRSPAAAATRQRLIDEVDRADAAADQLERNVSRLRAQVDHDRREAVALTGSGRSAADELKGLEAVTGAGAVEGPGIEVRVDDATAGPTATGDVRDDETQDGKVVDRDLQILVNGLWGAGAEAVSINGRRLTALTAIRAAGAAILVDYRPLRPPYEVRAIGDPDRLEARFADGAGGRYLKLLADNFGVRYRISTQREMRLPAASGVTLRHVDVSGSEGTS
jgi:uncharacterized protein YlxW (UPF0749 family)